MADGMSRKADLMLIELEDRSNLGWIRGKVCSFGGLKRHNAKISKYSNVFTKAKQLYPS